MDECQVCCEKFTSVTRKRVDCGWCEFAACTSCAQRYILDLPDAPSCMSCKHPWSREFLEGKFTKTFINGQLKKHREEVLFEIEKALLPETQPYAEMLKDSYDLKEKAKVMRKEMKELMRKGIPGNAGPVWYKAVRDRNVQVAILKEDIRYCENMIGHHQRRILRHETGTTDPTTTERRSFIKPCPTADCRGFLSTAWKCGLCSVKVCNKCHAIKTGDTTDGEGTSAGAAAAAAAAHVCKPEDVATVEMMAKDSKPCPKCGAMIQKIEGCSQMFHTPLSGGCGAVFDWNTLRLHTGADGTIHNPHWYEYQRHMNNGTVPRQLGDMVCGGMPNYGAVQQVITRLQAAGTATQRPINSNLTSFVNLHRAHNHNEHVVLPLWRVDMIGDNRVLRAEFLLKKYTEPKFKQLLQQREKAREKKQHIRQIMMMFQVASEDMLMRFVRVTDADEATSLLTEVKELVKYTNASFAKAAKLFNCVQPYVDHDFKIITLTKQKKTAA